MEQIDKAILERHQYTLPSPIKKPWMPTPDIPDLQNDHIETIYFPADEESSSMGEITVTWLGPKWNAFLQIQAIHMLNAYLSDTPIAPLKKVFVERNDPYCTELDFALAERSRMAITAHFQNVPLNKADDIVPKLISALHEIVNTQNIDMERMIALIRKEKLKVKPSKQHLTVHDTEKNSISSISFFYCLYILSNTSFLMNMKLVRHIW